MLLPGAKAAPDVHEQDLAVGAEARAAELAVAEDVDRELEPLAAEPATDQAAPPMETGCWAVMSGRWNLSDRSCKARRRLRFRVLEKTPLRRSAQRESRVAALRARSRRLTRIGE
jgi:hypothetical protein